MNWAATPGSSHKKTSALITSGGATWISMPRFSRKSVQGIPPHERGRRFYLDQAPPTSLHRSAQPALCRWTIRPGRPSSVPLAERSRHRHQLPRRRSAAAPCPRLGRTDSRPAHNSARAHLLLAPVARPQRRGHRPHLFRVLLVISARSGASVVIRKNKKKSEAAWDQDADQLPQRRSPRPPPTVPLGQVRPVSRG